MEWLTRELAQEIVDKMMQDISYSINIMNEKGIIIGSGNKKRIGTLHKGAVKAIESGEMVEIYKDDRFEKKGTNEPIVIGRELVGVVGITGNPGEVRPFCRVVKTAVSLLIEQSIAIGNREAERKRKEVFFETLLNEKQGYSQELFHEAEHYQMNLHVETTAVLIKDLEAGRTLLESFPFFTKQKEDISIVMFQNPHDAEKLTEKLLNMDKKCKVAAGKRLVNVAESYRQAYHCMKAAENLDLPGRYFSYESLQFIAELSQMEFLQTDSKGGNKRVDLPEMLLHTLRTYLKSDCNPSTAAQELMIHRNTLYYRLERIKQITGKDPDHILDLFELIYLLLQQ